MNMLPCCLKRLSLVLRSLLLLSVPYFASPGQNTEFGVNASTYLGDISGDESVYGMAYQTDGTLVVAVNLGPVTPGGVTPVYLNGATDQSRGTLLRLTGDGKSVLSVTRLAASVYDLSIDASDRLLVAAGSDGLLQLDPAAGSIVGSALVGSFVYRADSATDGHAVALVPDGLFDPDQKAGSGTVFVFDATLSQINSFSGGYQNTIDVAIDGISETVFTIGFSNKSTWGGVGFGPSTPVDVPGLKGVPYTYNPGLGIDARWSGYNWESNVWLDEAKTIPNPRYINYPFSTDEADLTEDRYPLVESSNMADTRGYRVEVAADGYLYAAFEFDGGNSPVRWSPFDLTDAVDPVGGDIFHQTFNTSTVPKVFFARYVPSTGEKLLSQWYTNRLFNATGPARDNTVRIKGGELWADAQGRVYIGGSSAYGLPMPGNGVYSPNPGESTFNPFLPTDYVGGAYFMAYSPDFSTRLYTTRLATGGNTRAIAVREIGSEPWPRIAWGGHSNLGSPVFTKNPIQPQPGYGDSDATIAVLGGGASDAAGVSFIADFESGYVTGSQQLRGQNPSNFTVDADGDGLTDDARAGYPLILPTGGIPAETPLSPPSGYTGPAFYGGFFSDRLDAAGSSLADRKVDNDELLIRSQPPDGVETLNHGVLFFPKSEFSGVQSTDIITFGAGDRMSIDGPGWGGGAKVRFLVRDGAAYFVSEEALGDEGGIDFILDVEDGRWARWEIPEDMNFDPATADFQERNFADITGVGLIVDTPTANDDRFFFRLRRFAAGLQVNAADNLPPVAGFTANPLRGAYPLSVNFDSASSSDPDGVINFVSWDFGDGGALGGNAVSNTYVASGRYLPSVAVFDDTLAKKRTSGEITVYFGISPDTDSIFASFGGDAVDNGEDFVRSFETLLDLDGDTSVDDYRKGYAFSATAPLTNSGVRGTALHGGLVLQSIDGEANFAERRIKDTGDSDEVSIRVEAGNAGGGALARGLLYIDKAYFLGDAQTQPVTFAPGSTFKVRTTARVDALGTIRWLVRDGETFFVSEASAPFTKNATSTLEFTSATDHGRWAIFDPLSDPGLDFDQTAAVYETRRFSDVTGIGIFFERDTYSGSRAWLTVDVIEATGLVGSPLEAAYADWLALWFTEAELQDAGLESTLWGLFADPDGDGPNALEILLVGNPELFDIPASVETQNDGSDLVMTFNLRKAVAGVPWPASFVIQDSPDLLPGNWSTAFDSALCDLAGPVCSQGDATYTVLEEFADHRRVEIRMPIGGARFVRFMVP